MPSTLEHPRFTAVPLTADVAALDYAAYMSSTDVIRVHSDDRWPVDDFTLADDLELVAKHQVDHERRRAFAFVLLAPSGDQALGCVYVNPLLEYLERAGAEPEVLEAMPSAAAMVTFWLRQDRQATDLADAVAEAVHDWLSTDWPLDKHFFRVLPEEESSRRALDRLDLQRTDFDLAGESRPYLWYGSA